MNKPLIGLPLCRWQLTDRDIGWFHLVGEKYISSVTGYGAFPLMIPAFADELDMDTVLDSVSGIMFGGSLSNVHPSFYGDEHPGLGLADKPRDATVLRLISSGVKRTRVLGGAGFLSRYAFLIASDRSLLASPQAFERAFSFSRLSATYCFLAATMRSLFFARYSRS